MEGLSYTLSDRYQNLLLLIHEKEEHTILMKSQVRSLKNTLSKIVKGQDDSAQTKKSIASFIDIILSDLETYALDVKRYEYFFLNQLGNGEKVGEGLIQDSMAKFQQRMLDIEAVYISTLEKVNHLEPGNLPEIRKLLSDLEQFIEERRPRLPLGDSSQGCRGLISRLLLP
jgi:hypothetical protein